MSAAACKAAICRNKAEYSSQNLSNIGHILASEKPELQIEVNEYIIKCNENTLAGVLKIIGDQ